MTSDAFPPIDWKQVANTARRRTHYVCFEEPDDPMIYRTDLGSLCEKQHPDLGCGFYNLVKDKT